MTIWLIVGIQKLAQFSGLPSSAAFLLAATSFFSLKYQVVQNVRRSDAAHEVVIEEGSHLDQVAAREACLG